VDLHRTGLGDQGRDRLCARRHRRLALDDPGAQRLGGLLLGDGGAAGHHDRARDPAPCGRHGEGGRMVAAAVGDDAAGRLVVGELEHRVGGPAQLEGTGGVQVLRLEVHTGTDPCVDRTGAQDRRRRHQRRQARGRREDVVEGDRHSSVA
jgi:hypothetical protein